MADTTSSQYMNLPVPIPGQDPGPQYATDVNSCLTIIDAHNHAPGYGQQITPSGLNINTDLPLNSNNMTLVRSIRFSAQGTAIPATGSDLGCISVGGVDLYYNDLNGNQIRLTQNGNVAGTSGSIGSLTPPASVNYVSASKTYQFNSDVNKRGNLDIASITLRNLTTSSNGLTVNPPPALGADYSIQLPSLPGSTLPLSMDSTGIMSAGQITLSQLVSSIQQALNPAGSILAFGGAAAPSGYLLCDGSAVSRASYSALFSAIGTNYGSGDGSTTFNLPDLRGQFLRGVTGASANDPDASSRTANNSGGNTGNNVGSQQSSQYAQHAHPNGNDTPMGSLNGYPSLPANTRYAGTGQASVSSAPGTGYSGGNETRPINVYVNFIIKT